MKLIPLIYLPTNLEVGFKPHSNIKRGIVIAVIKISGRAEKKNETNNYLLYCFPQTQNWFVSKQDVSRK